MLAALAQLALGVVLAALFLGALMLMLLPSWVSARLGALDWRHPLASWREAAGLERRYWEVRRVYDLYVGTELWNRHIDAFLATRGHLPLGAGTWTEHHWGGARMAPPHDRIHTEIARMYAQMTGELDYCACFTCARDLPSTETVLSAMAAIGIPRERC